MAVAPMAGPGLIGAHRGAGAGFQMSRRWKGAWAQISCPCQHWGMGVAWREAPRARLAHYQPCAVTLYEPDTHHHG